MTVYERNLKELAEHYPGIDQLIRDAREKVGESDISLQEEASYDGRRILKATKGGKTLYLNGKRDTADPACGWVKSLGELRENAPVIMMGVGNETYLEELMNGAKNRLVVIVYEPSMEIFLDFLEHVSIGLWMRHHTAIFWVEGLKGMGIDTLGMLLGQALSYETAPFFRMFVLPNYDVLFPEESLAFVKACHSVIEGGKVSFNTRALFADVSVRNMLDNAPFLCSGYKTTQIPYVLPEGLTGIVVAAGPSLNKNIGELKKAKGKAFIIATDTAVKPLLKVGIMPDMFVIVDAKKPLALVQAEEAREVPLLTTMDAPPEILRYHTGMKFFANEGVRFVDRIFSRCDGAFGIASSGGSVATAAFTLLYKIGIETIILVGQDLALTNNRTHADGTFEERMPELDTSGFPMVEGNDGGKVPTRPDFQIYLKWYNEFIEGCQKYDPEFRVINATEGGAKIKNTEVMALKEAIERECVVEVDIRECLNKLQPMFQGENQKWAIRQIKGIPEEWGKLVEDADEMVRLYRKLDAACRKKTLSRKAYLRITKQLDKQVKKIERQDMYQLVVRTLNTAQYIIENEQFVSFGGVQDEGIEVARKGILYMGLVSECAQAFQEYAKSIFEEWEPDISQLSKEEKNETLQEMHHAGHEAGNHV